MEKDIILSVKDHRPVEFPNGQWIMQQTWKDLLFIHYKVPVSILREVVPKRFTIDTYNGDAWITISPLKMRNVKFRLLPPIPTTYNFLELNLRTYVKFNSKPGIYFFSLDTSSTLNTLGARFTALPYYKAKMTISGDNGFHFTSKRIGKTKTPAEFEVKYKPTSSAFHCEKDTLNYWLMERYCLFQRKKENVYVEIDIHHLPWQLQNTDFQVIKNTLLVPLGIMLFDKNPVIHYSAKKDVLIWSPKSYSFR